MTIFTKHFILFASQGYGYDLIKLNKVLLFCHLFHKKLELQSLQICFQIQFYLHIITLPWDINHKFKTCVLHFKLIHLFSWIHIIWVTIATIYMFKLISTFSNFFGESKEVEREITQYCSINISVISLFTVDTN